MDDRGRVPFALVGVVLLVTATAVGATLATRDTPAETNAADRAADRALAGARIALERATIEASAAAAANPVVTPANTPYGRVLRDDSAFRDALALRVYAAACAAFTDLDTRHGDATARVSLDVIDSPRDARRAIRAVTLDELRPNRVRVTVRNATLAVTEHGESVGVRERAVSVVVDTPVLALHDRMASFAARVDRGVLQGYGLAREATLRLAPYTAARGLAQYAGAPIANVLANRHVEVAANDGLLAVQRATFGRASTASNEAVGRAYALTGVRDMLAVTRASARARATRIFGAMNVTPTQPPSHPPAQSSLTPAAAADTALLDALNALDAVLENASRLDARRLVRVTRTDHRLDTATPPQNWTRVATDTTTETAVTAATAGAVGVFDVHNAFRVLDAFGRRVTVTRTTRASWTNGSAVRTVTGIERSTYRVSVALTARPAALDGVPNRPVDALGERATAAVRSALLPDGADSLAARAVTGDAGTRSATVRVSQPPSLRERAARSLGRIRNRVANTSTAVRVSGAGVLASSPVSALARTLAANRDHLVAAPARYDSIAERALTAVRAHYLDDALAVVRERAGDAASVRGALRDTVTRLGGWVPTGVTARETPETVVSEVSVSPRYLSLTDAETLAARNLNVFTLPYGDAADTVTDAAFDGGERAVRLAVAADLLAAAGTRTPDLAAAVRAETARARERFAAVLDARTGLDSGAAERVVSSAATRWRTDAARARAATNGSLAAAVVADSGTRGAKRVALAAALRAESRAVARSDTGGVDEDVVRAARQATRAELTAALGRASTRRVKRALGGRLAALPAGLPVAPLPGFWYATVNVWAVSVRGGYERVAISGGALPPGFDAGAYEYVREGGVVSLDVDGDSRPEPLGRNARVEFAFDTVVVAAVPPGPRGVGDTDGNADERSPGW
ncbi:hypothetical protein [Salarchaeum sp. JOR-1]|uniref:DUF7286 family protein n=1 Tax=Salarchaeum sp. JOR-1 TaxID=2599399 RepID=UPI0011987896|nr:hypothetical protein [Salarchaeum sp. JOR-1]QDX39792.1 hypothetical protein FQU85_02345 [Salarchaeum sp. JOR-1]